MNKTNNSLKTAHILLGVPAIYTCLLLLALLIFNIYLVFAAGQDPNGGGWIIFYQMILGMFFIPLLVLAIAHCITCLISFLQREKRKKASKVLGIVSSILGIITMVLSLPCTFIFVIDGTAVAVLLPVTFLEFLSIISLIIALVFFAKTKIQS
ncbi:MAG: hypothetical protein IJZ42_09615 [Lachnospiraceae bacterium]|nr:hypothetical protein [Lachnospiraceae bacterium]